MSENKTLIVGVGSALVDILAHENDNFLSKAGAVKGGMIYVESKDIDRILSMLSEPPVIVPGGSACNTMVGIAKLGRNARFIGKSGTDESARFFEDSLKKTGADPIILKSSSPTGRVLSIVTPDAQRSMLTYLGAAAELSAQDISEKFFKHAAIVHVEGYLLFNRELITAIAEAVKHAGAKFSLDLASFTVVESSKDFLKPFVKDYADILIANEDEAFAFTGHRDELEAIGALSRNADIAVLKLGKRGSMISASGQIVNIAPMGDGKALDTTGAGDLWASGFLFGSINGYPMEKCGQLGSACGYEVCQVMGASIPEEGWKRIRNLL
jgi:sugar/nucleoside kinase (ribokinase family)